MNIHPTAIIEEGAQLGDGCVIHAHAIVKRGALLGEKVVVHAFAVVGGDPQYLKFDPAIESAVRIGPGSVLREHVTINRSIHSGQATVLGARCFLMAGSHVAHDCLVGHDVVLANNALLGGHVAVGDNTFVGGGAAVHQFCRVGDGVMIGGVSPITQDVAPYLMVADRNEVAGLNLVGLRRRGVAREAIAELKDCYHAVFGGGDPRKLAAARLGAGVQGGEARRFLEFFAGGKRGFARPSGRTVTTSDEA
jgi:UDP-N-acetylglucosamine acyltransferase